jgi:hypothetical protein
LLKPIGFSIARWEDLSILSDIINPAVFRIGQNRFRPLYSRLNPVVTDNVLKILLPQTRQTEKICDIWTGCEISCYNKDIRLTQVAAVRDFLRDLFHIIRNIPDRLTDHPIYLLSPQ